jgi:hypothetical protein
LRLNQTQHQLRSDDRIGCATTLLKHFEGGFGGHGVGRGHGHFGIPLGEVKVLLLSDSWQTAECQPDEQASSKHDLTGKGARRVREI